jgi:hypothetical protein
MAEKPLDILVADGDIGRIRNRVSFHAAGVAT